MNIFYPIHFTKGGRGVKWWLPHNKINVKINYTGGLSPVVTCHLDYQDLIEPFTFNPKYVSGYFFENGERIRVTNLSGFNGVSIMKYCPSCLRIKTITEFDYMGRYTNGQRDQSNCMECRKSY